MERKLTKEDVLKEIENLSEATLNVPNTPTRLPDDVDELIPNSNLTFLEKKIALAKIEGGSFKGISSYTRLSINIIKEILSRKRVRDFIKQFNKEVSLSVKEHRESLMAQILEARLNNMEENDIANLSNKDTLDIIVALDNSQKEREKAELGTNNTIVNVLNLIKK